MSYPYTALERAHIHSLRSRRLIGTPASVKEQLSRLVERTQADEAMITTLFYGHENRLRAYELLAEVFGL